MVARWRTRYHWDMVAARCDRWHDGTLLQGLQGGIVARLDGAGTEAWRECGMVPRRSGGDQMHGTMKAQSLNKCLSYYYYAQSC